MASKERAGCWTLTLLLFVAVLFMLGIGASFRHMDSIRLSDGSSRLRSASLHLLQAATDNSAMVDPIQANSGDGWASAPEHMTDAPASPPTTKQPIIISHLPNVEATCDVRGNLGPCGVILQNPPGDDWLKDRWQAASDMGGTAIPGTHWVMLDFKSLVHVLAIVLDWETAYAKDYRLYGRRDDNDAWHEFYDGGTPTELIGNGFRKSHSFGQSPGVKTKMPLHVVHTLNWTSMGGSGENSKDKGDAYRTLRYLRIYIRKPAIGWGVSLWQVDVFGTQLFEQ